MTVALAVASRDVVPEPAGSASVSIATSPGRDRDLVEPFDAKPAVELVGVPVRRNSADPIVGRDLQHPGLVEVDMLFQVGCAEKGVGLGAFDSDLGYGGGCGCSQKPSPPGHPVGGGTGPPPHGRH